MSFKRKTLLCTLSVAIAAAIAMPVALAGGPLKYQRINLGTLNEDGAYDEFVVKYRADSAQRKSKTELSRSLNKATATAFPAMTTSTGKLAVPALTATHKRRLAVGADVFLTSRKLDRVEAEALMRQIAADPAVEYVERSIRMVKFATPNDTHFALQWGLKIPAESAGGINLPPALDKANGTGVVVAVLDTGVTAHPDLSANVLLADGYDFNERKPGGADPGDWTAAGECGTGSPAQESSWHGTHVSGTIAAVTNNAMGVAGVAPQAVILPVRVLGKCGGSSADIADAMMWTAGATVAGAPVNTHQVEVINMSLGGSRPGSCPNVYKDALAYVQQQNITVVVAAGNSDADVTGAGGTGYTMGNCSNDIVVVGGIGPLGRRGGVASNGQTEAGWGSNWGSRVDIAGPMGSGWTSGEEQVLSTVNLGASVPAGAGYAFYYGTSMASPHVAGVVALMQSAAETRLTPAQVKEMLKDTARAFPATPDKAIGVGIVDASAAVDAAIEGPCTENCGPVATPLVNKVKVTGLSGAAGSEKLYSFQAQAGKVLSFISLGGTGNVSMYVSFDAEPTAASSHFRSTRPGNSETVRVTAPRAGTYYIKLVGTGAYSGVTLVARQ